MRIPFGFTEKCRMNVQSPGQRMPPTFTVTAVSIDAKQAARTPTAGTDSWKPACFTKNERFQVVSFLVSASLCVEHVWSCLFKDQKSFLN